MFFPSNIKSGVKIFNVTGSMSSGYSHKNYTASELMGICVDDTSSNPRWTTLTFPYKLKGIILGYHYNLGYNATQNLKYINLAVTGSESSNANAMTFTISYSGSSTIVKWVHTYDSTYGWTSVTFTSYSYGYYFKTTQYCYIIY